MLTRLVSILVYNSVLYQRVNSRQKMLLGIMQTKTLVSHRHFNLYLKSVYKVNNFTSYLNCFIFFVKWLASSLLFYSSQQAIGLYSGLLDRIREQSHTARGKWKLQLSQIQRKRKWSAQFFILSFPVGLRIQKS